MKQYGAIALEDGLEKMLEQIEKTKKTEKISILEAENRICASRVCARMQVPPFDRSAVDGYAVLSQDFIRLEKGDFVELNVVENIFAGDDNQVVLAEGTACKIMTGAKIPKGADAIVRQEDTDFGTETVKVFEKIKPFENYCFQGEDVKRDAVLLEEGELITDLNIGVLASQGIAQVEVFCRVRVGILATGSEVVSLGEPLKGGQIYDSNSPVLYARLLQMGAIPILSRIGLDDISEIANKIEELVQTCDFVVTTGGVSVGEKDYLREVVEFIGGELLFHGLALKPGSPALAMLYQNKVVLSLSGNPFAAYATFTLLAQPIIYKRSGRAQIHLERIQARLNGQFPKKSVGRRFIRGRILGGEVFVLPSGHSSGMIGSLPKANCLIDIPANSDCLCEGALVDVILQ